MGMRARGGRFPPTVRVKARLRESRDPTKTTTMRPMKTVMKTKTMAMKKTKQGSFHTADRVSQTVEKSLVQRNDTCRAPPYFQATFAPLYSQSTDSTHPMVLDAHSLEHFFFNDMENF